MVPGWFIHAKWLVSTLVLVLVVGACGGAAATPLPKAAVAPAATAAPVPAATPATAPQAKTAVRGGELRIGMTAADIPLTDVATDQGFEGWRFVGFQLNNGLTTWDWNGERIPGPIPGLAESWKVDSSGTVWTFRLREGLKFHDGTPIDANAVVLGTYRLFNKGHPYYSSKVAGLILWLWGETCCKDDGSSYRAIDFRTVELTTKQRTGYVPVASIFTHIGSPTALEKWGSEGFPDHHVGAGPFKMVSKTPRVSLVMERFEDYWGKKPNVDRVILRPLPETTTRLAALRAGEVDWIEVPPPDAVPLLKKEGFQVYTKVYPHSWNYQFNLRKAPFDNKLVRKAMMYAIDRESMCRDLLNGTCIPATGFTYPGHVSFGNPKETYSYNPEKARQLLKEAGVKTPLKFKVLISTAGSGQMLPLQMNEFIQRNLKDVGIEMELEPVDWNTLLSRAAFGKVGYTFTGINEGLNAFNISNAHVAPFQWNRFQSGAAINYGGYSNPEVDNILKAAREALELPEQDRLLAKAHEILVDELPYLFVVHDLNPRVLSPRVKGYIQDQSWFTTLQDLWIQR